MLKPVSYVSECYIQFCAFSFCFFTLFFNRLTDAIASATSVVEWDPHTHINPRTGKRIPTPTFHFDKFNGYVRRADDEQKKSTLSRYEQFLEIMDCIRSLYTFCRSLFFTLFRSIPFFLHLRLASPLSSHSSRRASIIFRCSASPEWCPSAPSIEHNLAVFNNANDLYEVYSAPIIEE